MFSNLDCATGVLAKNDLVTGFDVQRTHVAAISHFAGPAARISPCDGFSVAESGSTMPPALVVSLPNDARQRGRVRVRYVH